MSGHVPEAVRARVRADAGDRCGYCLAAQEQVYNWLTIEHIIPRGAGGSDDEDNLWLSCQMCNTYKAMQTHGPDPATGRRIRLFNPRRQRWSAHFRWTADGAEVVGRTATGRATVAALRMNNPIAVKVRSGWVVAGWYPPKNVP